MMTEKKRASKGCWSDEEVNDLLDQILNNVKDSTTLSYNSVPINWEAISVGTRNSEQCQRMWHVLLKKIRKTRSYTELIEEVKANLPGLNKRYRTGKVVNPDAPKRPLTAYLRFYTKNYQKFRRKNPKLDNGDIAKIISNKYKTLSPSRKEKYNQRYLEEKAQFNVELEKYRKKHPEDFQTKKKEQGKLKFLTPMELFIEERMKKKLKESPETDVTAYRRKARKRFRNLSDKKRVKYINKIIEEAERYKEEMNGSDDESKPKPLVTKRDMKLKRRCEGTSRPLSGFQIFCKDFCSQHPDLPNHEKFALIGKKWKEMSKGEREKFNDQSQSRKCVRNRIKRECEENMSDVAEDEVPADETMET